jgi:hypothetical protein
MIARLSLSQIASYLDTRKSQGFNAVMIELSSHQQAAFSGCPANVNGDQPFLKNVSGGTYVGTTATADFSTPNPVYWDWVDQVLDLISSRNFLCLAYVMAWGFGLDGTQGWWPDMMLSANTRAVHSTFGSYLGNRLNKRTNVWALHGSDSFGNTTGTPESGIARAFSLATGMISAGFTQGHSGDWAVASESLDGPADVTASVDWTTIISRNGAYTVGGSFTLGAAFDGHTYLEARRGWNDGLVSWGKEMAYKTSPFAPGADQDLRNSQMWLFYSGCTGGMFYGYDNGVATHGVWCFNTNWTSDILDSSALDFQRFNNMLDGFAWWNLVPSELSGMPLLVTSANGSQTGSPAGYVAAACASDGSFMHVFFPYTSGGGSQNATVVMSQMAGTSSAQWWDPRSGALSSAGSGISNSGTHVFTTPGNNSSGFNDWVLLVTVP